MKNIALDLRPLLEKTWGGVSWYTYYLTAGLINEAARRDLKVFLFYNQKKTLTYNIAKLLKQWRASQNVKICGYRIPNKLLNLSTQFLKYPNIDELLTIKQSNSLPIKSIDCFILPNLSFIALTSRVRRIAVCHDLSFEVFPEFYTWRQRLWHRLINPSEFYQKADLVIAVSENTKQDLIDLYKIPAGKIIVSYPGIDHQRFKIFNPAATALKKARAKYRLPRDFILFVGILEPRKNLETLIEAYDLACEATSPPLIIVGPEGWKFDRIYRFWIAAKHKPQIRFINQVADADLPAIYNLARLFVYPSFYEGFGFPPLEACACGTPVIVGHGSSLPEVIGGAGVLVDPFNVADLARALKQMLNEPALYDTLKQKGKEHASQYTWQKTMEKILAVLLR